MKRDMDLVLAVLLAIEECDQSALRDVPDISGFDRELVVEHLFLLRDAGMVEFIDCTTMEGRDAMEMRLTWRGHDFIDSVRDPEVWRKTKEGAAKLGGWTVGILAELGKGFLLQKARDIGLPL